MKIKLYNRGTKLFKKGKRHIYAYIVLLGVVNLYDECDHDHSDEDDHHNHSHSSNSHIGELITHRKEGQDSHRDHHKHKHKVIYEDQSKMLKTTMKSAMSSLVSRQSQLQSKRASSSQNGDARDTGGNLLSTTDLAIFDKVVLNKDVPKNQSEQKKIEEKTEDDTCSDHLE